MTHKRDRRVERTHRLLRDALISLIMERGYEAITVHDIVERASVGRSTFYTHFSDKQELLLSDVEWRRLVRELKAASKGDSRPFAFTQVFFDHVDAYRDVYRAIAGGRAGEIIERALAGVLADATGEDMKRDNRRPRDVPPDAAANYVAGGLMALTAWWLQRSSSMSAAEVNALFHRLLLHGIS